RSGDRCRRCALTTRRRVPAPAAAPRAARTAVRRSSSLWHCTARCQARAILPGPGDGTLTARVTSTYPTALPPEARGFSGNFRSTGLGKEVDIYDGRATSSPRRVRRVADRTVAGPRPAVRAAAGVPHDDRPRRGGDDGPHQAGQDGHRPQGR